MKLLTCLRAQPAALLAMIVFGALVAGCRDTAEDQRAAQSANNAARADAGVEATAPTAERILKTMFTAYHEAKSYADSGRLREQAIVQGQNHDATPLPFEVTFQRPNRLRMRILETTAVSDGEKIHAAIDSLPGQVLEGPAPARLSMSNFPPDDLLREAMKGGRDIFAPPQFALLLGESPAEVAEKLAATASLLEDQTFDGQLCFRVQFKGPGGNHIYWIDKESYVLRRIDLPTEELTKGLDPAVDVRDLKVWLELTDARLGATIDGQAFGFEIPEGARRLKHFVTPVPGPRPERIGETIGEFAFTALDESTVDRKSLEGKLTVLDFWFVNCGYCKISMPALEKVYQTFKDNDRVRFFAVSTDEPSVTNQQLEQTLQSWGATIPIVRDLESHGMERLNVFAAPTTILLDGNGKVQRYQQGSHADYGPLGEAIDRLLAGDDLAAQALEAYEAEIKDYGMRLEAASVDPGQATLDVPQNPRDGDQAALASIDPGQATVEVPPVEIPPRSEPELVKLEKLWQAEDLKKPGNILVISAENQSPQFLVLDGWRTVAEVDSSGKVIQRHELPIPEHAAITFLRSATDKQGKRFFVASGVAQQQLFLFDQNWQLQWSFPEDGDHAGIADVLLADLAGDGQLQLVVGYWGDVGVQGVALDGRRIWTNRSLQNSLQLAATAPDSAAVRRVMCVNSRGTLVPVDREGKHEPDIRVPQRAIMNIVSADLDGDSSVHWCALATVGVGKQVAIGLEADGNELWHYEMPDGVHKDPVEPIVPANLSADHGGWLLPGANGSIHFLTKEGRLVDRFHYGSAVAGLALARIDDQPVLVVSSDDGLIAWKLIIPNGE